MVRVGQRDFLLGHRKASKMTIRINHEPRNGQKWLKVRQQHPMAYVHGNAINDFSQQH